MKASVVIVYHNRVKNLDYWLHIISKVDRKDCTFTIIHNCDKPFPALQKQIEAAGVRYIPRANTGFDVGAFQDVCRKRLKGFDYDYEYLLWFTDDCFAMKPDFISSFIKPYETDPEAGLTCLELSTQIRKHVRTTGFCVRREFAERMKFSVDPVKTKEQCYQFEHRGPHTLYEQALTTSKVIQIAALNVSPAWDSGGGGHGWVNRRQEFEKAWGTGIKGSKVIVIAPAFVRRPMIAESMLMQTYHNWELYLVHDGLAPADFPKYDDKRIHFVVEKGPRQKFGHPIREQYLQKIRAGHITGDYVVVTNDDNYHAPFYLEKLVRALDENPGTPGAFCSAMVHNYKGFPNVPGKMSPDNSHQLDGYGIIECKPLRGHIDCACVMVRAEIAGKVGWPDYSHSSDWTYLNRIAQTSGGWAKFKVVPGVLLVHN